MSLREKFLEFAQTAEDNAGSDEQASALRGRLDKCNMQERRTLFATISAGMSMDPVSNWQTLLDQSNFDDRRVSALFHDANIAIYVVMGCNNVMSFNPDILK